MSRILSSFAAPLVFLVLMFSYVESARAQQEADSKFVPKIKEPAYKDKKPKVFLDEAHQNFHTMDGRYKPFADLLKADGYDVKPNLKTFDAESLKDCEVLVIANAIGGDHEMPASAFTEAECEAVKTWVDAGGRLFLIADHAPFGTCAENLSKKFDVEMSKGFTLDSKHSFAEFKSQSVLVYSDENKLFGDHAVVRGRNDKEKVHKIVAFTGQSLKGPKDSVAFLKLADTAEDMMPTSKKKTSAKGRAQGIALTQGKGRVIVLGEAGMLSAQLVGADKHPMGMNVPGIDNKQFALNMMHWLSGLID